MRIPFLRSLNLQYLEGRAFDKLLLRPGGGGPYKRTFPVQRQLSSSTTHDSVFQPKRVLILTKLSRLEFEQLRQPEVTHDSDLETVLRKRGSDYSTLLYHHYIHKGCESRVHNCFQEFGVETRLINRFNYTEENIDWADVIVTTGGDGTFLMAACKIQDSNKPVIGFNTDPTRSEGYLCLPRKYSINVREAIRKLFEGKFRWTFRRRIRITLCGESVFDPPIELHDQQLSHPEYRFFDCLQEQHHSVTARSTSSPAADAYKHQSRVLPVLALNEVYFGECVSARVSYMELSVDGGEKVKSKNAGLCVSTGTGSTSWSYNINKMNRQMVQTILELAEKDEAKLSSNKGTSQQQPKISRSSNKLLVDRLTKQYNNQLIFSPESSQMMYTMRDPIASYTLPYAQEIPPRGCANKLDVRSRCFDACLVIDGGLSFSFNDGTHATVEMHDSDALKTVIDLADFEEEEGQQHQSQRRGSHTKIK